MHLDIPTLLAADALATAFCAGARILLWRIHPGLPGLSQWAWASVLGATALAVAAAAASRGTLAPSALFLSETMAACGFIVSWDGFRRFLGRPSLPKATMAMLATATVSLLAVPLLELRFAPQGAVRELAVAMMAAGLSALIARELLRAIPTTRQGRRSKRAIWLTAWVYVANTVLFGGRVGTALRDILAGDAALSYPLSVTLLLWWLCMTVAVTLGMALMTGERLQTELAEQATRDPLTGALNRRAFGLIAEKELAWARRSHQPISLLMMDLDHFKQINDRLGHAAGDAILCRFVTVAERHLRTADVLCRFGGEEFIVLLPGSGAYDAWSAAERLRHAYAAETSDFDLPFSCTVSIGVGEIRADETLDQALARTDAALYRAKSAGRNRSEFTDPTLCLQTTA